MACRRKGKYLVWIQAPTKERIPVFRRAFVSQAQSQRSAWAAPRARDGGGDCAGSQGPSEPGCHHGHDQPGLWTRRTGSQSCRPV